MFNPTQLNLQALLNSGTVPLPSPLPAPMQSMLNPQMNPQLNSYMQMSTNNNNFSLSNLIQESLNTPEAQTITNMLTPSNETNSNQTNTI